MSGTQRLCLNSFKGVFDPDLAAWQMLDNWRMSSHNKPRLLCKGCKSKDNWNRQTRIDTWHGHAVHGIVQSVRFDQSLRPRRSVKEPSHWIADSALYMSRTLCVCLNFINASITSPASQVFHEAWIPQAITANWGSKKLPSFEFIYTFHKPSFLWSRVA